jgi:formate hydrogenlyase subunit 6/NADH:ubiquinone oxidoreductase subunit I
LRYFRNIKETVATIFEGMSVTFSHFMRRPYTVQYPDRMPMRIQDTLPFRYRGILEVDLEICTGCLACERACPIDCIVIDAEKDKAAGGLVMTRFDIDMGKCMYCGLCSEPCPTGAIHHTPEFEGADYSLESLVRRFVKAPTIAYKPKKTGETDPTIKPILDRGMRYIAEFAKGGNGLCAARHDDYALKRLGELFARVRAFDGGNDGAGARSREKNHHVEFAFDERLGKGERFG